MEFAAPAALVLGFLALPLAMLAWKWRRSTGVGIASTASFRTPRPTLRLRLARLLPIVRIAALLLLVAAIAGPRVGDANAVVPAQGIDIALSLDISSSMTTSKLGNTTRLDATKKVLRDFIKGRQNDRIGLVVFQEDALALSPPTLDYKALDRMVADVKSGLLPDGTGIGVGLASALNMLRDSPAASRIVILLTDGEHNAPSISPSDAADLAASLKIHVYTIGVINKDAGRGQVDEQLLKRIANKTGGRYYAVDNPQTLADVYTEIGRLETSKVGREHYERFTELAPWFAGGAAALIAAELLLRATWLRRAAA